MLTLEIMHAMWPNGDNSVPGLVEGIRGSRADSLC